MNVIICLDDNQGMLFNKRRQSRDAKVIEDISRLTNQLWISPFSEKLFEDINIEIIISNALLEQAPKESYCFIEDQILKPYESNIEQLVIYKWNRKYPSDFKLDLNLNEWKLIGSVDFVGNSHDKITKEIYILIPKLY